MKKSPLAGIRVIELGQLLAVPFAGRLLADLGAEIIKVESPVKLDSYRRSGFPDNEPGEAYWNRGGNFYNENRGKLSITLDLRVPEAREVFLDLVRVSDAVMENYASRVMANFGLDYESLRKVKPDLVMLSSTGYGHSGPWANFRAANPATEGASGLAAVSGYRSGPPVLPDVPHTDYVAAEQAVFAITLALYRRRRSGQGSYIDLSQVEAQASLMGEAFMDAAVNVTQAVRNGNRHPAMAPHGIYPCRGNDRWIAIAVTDDETFRCLARAMDEPAWADALRFQTAASRLAQVEDLEAHLVEWTRTQDAMELMHHLQAHGVPAGAVFNSRDLVTNKHLRARGFFRWLEHPQGAGIDVKPYPGAGWHFTGSTSGVGRRAPALGEHNDYVMTELLQYDMHHITKVKRSGAMNNSPQEFHRPVPLPLSDQLKQGRLLEIDADFYLSIGPDSSVNS